MDIRFLGHSCVHIVHEGTHILIDPFLTGNPVATVKAEEIKADYILLTHGHNDHVGDTASIAQANGSTIVAIFELAEYFNSQGLQTFGLSVGGGYSFPFGRVKMTNALHGTGYMVDHSGKSIYMGVAGGFLLTIGDKTIYHAGDTGLFGDMELIGKYNKIDVAFLPIGDIYTMGPEDAVIAAKMLGAKEVVPIHYNTFPGLAQDDEKFVQDLEKQGIRGRILKPGESFIL
ncbi:metal-dependent hydrolase [Brevibacillus dissolubilis]|uniref:metal-dependent hydrolase n=1 Tax=Brevibacillus dissolubilis TaxID=1844116 RepID=UPI0011164881|nr:metal-dependent hydrolase [Brevibacillus dissolubilis]